MSRELNVVLEQDGDGVYVCCPELPGCHSQGDTVEEAMDNMGEAIALYLETLGEKERTQFLRR
jgi:predicted RNase H-like HicB family nuclease